jgi:hypothetical protein
MKSLEKRKKIVKKFMPKKIISIRAIISDHAILRYKERFNMPNGNSKKALKSILKKGKIVLACDGRNMVVAKDRTYLIISNGEVKTVYTKEMFDSSIERIRKRWAESDD